MIENIKYIFQTKEVYDVYSLCMYSSTYEKFIVRAKDYIEDTNTNIYGFYDGRLLLGTIVVKNYGNNKAEILGIAVNRTYRNKHIGKQLIEFSVKNGNIIELFAETDDDTVLFYDKCGFKTEGFYKNYDGTPCKRYKCSYYPK